MIPAVALLSAFVASHSCTSGNSRQQSNLSLSNIFLPFQPVIPVSLILSDMKKLFLFCFAACLSVVVSAQKVYFLYLQTDDQSPFYVRMADKIHSSSTAGYLILPNLTDSTYSLGLGFAKSTQPETRFAVTINQNDKGYLIKNFTEGLSLFDLQDLSIVKSVSAAKDNTVYETKTDKFSSVLSKAADDPSLLKVAVAKKEEPKPEPKKEEAVAKVEEKKQPEKTEPVVTQPILTADIKTVTKEEAKPETPKKEETIVKQTVTPLEEVAKTEEKAQDKIENGSLKSEELAEYKRSKIIRKSESSTTEGFGVVFYDRMQNHTDTVRILIPPSKIRIAEETQTVSMPEEKKENIPANVTTTEKKEAKVDELITASEIKEKTEPKANNVAINDNCKGNASDKDFMKLRKNMAAEENDEEMIDEARKVYKNKCFTVEQLRYLSTLFLTSAAKYQFFDASYSNVSDRQNFRTLQSEIKDEYYLKRFKALVGE
ncbi:MAG: DUF4476 domain-containing protein [Chitinophagaceae bacterium]|nr:MAG: DUF4476 domain-containing protein [Chitinophagaceae bacterium]